MAIVGFITVDLGLRIPGYPEGLTSATAHDKMVEFGALGNIALFIGIAEMVSWIGVAQMLQGSGRKPGDFGINPMKLDEAGMKEMQLKELRNGRLAMMAIGGAITQSVLFEKGFPYF